MTFIRRSWWLGVLLLLAACGGGGSGGAAHVKVLVTDKRFDLDLVQEALVRVTKITLSRTEGDDDDEDGESLDDGDHNGDGGGDGNDDDQGGNDDDQGDGGHHSNDTVTLFNGPPVVVSLLDLRDGISAELTEGKVPAGRYRSALLYIDDAKLTLTNGNVYSTTDGTLDLAGADSQGLKIHFDPPLDVSGTGDTALLLDFDLSKTFIPVPADDPLNATKFLIRPGIRATNRTNTGDLRGTITEDDGTGKQVGVDKATVYVLPPGVTDTTQSVATTATASDGSYAVLGLKPGTYDILAVKDPKQATSTGVTITAAHQTDLDLSIQ